MVIAFRSLKFLTWQAALATALLAFWFSTTTAFSLISENVPKSAGRAAPPTANRVQQVMTGSSTRALENKFVLASGLTLVSSRPLAVSSSQPLHVLTMIALVLRSQPSSYSEQVAALPKGESVTVNSKQGRWWQVTTGAGQQGWLFSSYLRSRSG